jgi:hypothetical protein
LPVSEKAVRAAVIAALDAGQAHGYGLDDLKLATATPEYYNEVTVVARFGGVARLSSQLGVGPYRIAVRSVGNTEDGALEMRARGRAALEYQFLNVEGALMTPIQFETAEIVGEDSGWWSGLMTLTCNLKRSTS